MNDTSYTWSPAQPVNIVAVETEQQERELYKRQWRKESGLFSDLLGGWVGNGAGRNGVYGTGGVGIRLPGHKAVVLHNEEGV